MRWMWRTLWRSEQVAGRSAAVDRIAVANMVLIDDASARDEGLVRQRQDAVMSRLRAEPVRWMRHLC